MKTPPAFKHPHRTQGVALILVLCFIVLITGLVVAYFSRTLTTRQLSNASTSTTQAEMLASSAADVILSDLKQEIANGSLVAVPSPSPLPDGGTIYAPTKAAYAVPQRNALPLPAPTGFPNLVRRSLYDDGNGGAHAAPFPAPASGSRASMLASDKPGKNGNGHAVSAARWNRHYLLPTATPAPGATSAPIDPSTPATEFIAPDWVFVTAEKGSDVLNTADPSKDTDGKSVTATGRYAYAIYDEGGLLDINHTGYPSASTQSHIGAKPAPSYADLTQLPTPNPATSTATTSAPTPSPLITTTVDNLLGWRNYATLQVSGTFPTLQVPISSAVDTAYYNLFASTTALANSTPTSLLQVPPTLYNNSTDQLFLSRQQLIGYFTAANLDKSYLQYLGTFSRSLNQPSYLPEHSPTSLVPSTSTTNLDPAERRPVLPADRGGNDGNGNPNINPNFLTARVAHKFTRYDGTDAIIGEPLVKKRFPLNRLAWLTYKGPSADRNTAATDPNGPDADIVALKRDYGITKEWLDQGTSNPRTGNVVKYFGLTWNSTTKWSYSHGSNGINGAILNVINTASGIDVVSLTGADAREPDFFELLKASINPGSIAKASLSQSLILAEGQSAAHAPQDQYKLDSSVDAAIMQIGANIIDQFDTDGFPTQIHYDRYAAGGAASLLPFVCGDENLPYISRVRSGLIHLAEADPVETDTNDATKTKPILDTGIAALMNYPEIWNLHDWSASNNQSVAQSMGAVAPKNFKIFARANDSDGFRQATTMAVWNQANVNSCDANQTKSPGFTSKYGFPFGTPNSGQGGEPRYLSESNTRMTFNIDSSSTAGEALFREPTLLYAPNVPTGTSLASNSLVPTNTGGARPQEGLGYLTKNPTFFGSGGGLISVVGSSGSNPSPAKNTTYIGFYIGAQPMRFWIGDDDPAKGGYSSPQYQTQYTPVNDTIYTLACEDGPNSGVYIPYDVKPMTTTGQPNADLQKTLDSGSGFNGTYELDRGVRYYQTMDPRSARFGMVDPWISANTNSIPPRSIYSGILNPKAASPLATLWTDRQYANAGTALYTGQMTPSWFPNSMGWYPPGVTSAADAFRPGLLTQNSPYAPSDGRIAPASARMPAGSIGGATGAFFYADADGVVRRAMGGNVNSASGTPASTTVGLPMASAGGSSSGSGAQQVDSRPSILNRPFRSVTELGYVYSGTPWKNLDFFLPESGNSALLDVFCINDTSDSNALTAGQVNLNTHQVPVLQAILAQTSKDQWNDAATTAATRILGTAANPQAQQLAQLLVNRTAVAPLSGPNTTSGPQPLQNVGDLVGRWVKPIPVAGTNVLDGNASCDGFTADLATFLNSGVGADQPMHNIKRFGESAVRALSNAGQTRVWNLLIDVVAQTGRYPAQAKTLDQFTVEGEQHYWMHVAIDRYTGQVLDKQVEVVKE